MAEESGAELVGAEVPENDRMVDLSEDQGGTKACDQQVLGLRSSGGVDPVGKGTELDLAAAVGALLVKKRI